jgi:hypothetical protein
MTLTTDLETPEQMIARLERELAHVQEQARVTWASAQTWKQRALAAEEQVRRLQHKLDRRQAKHEGPEANGHTDDALDAFEGIADGVA